MTSSYDNIFTDDKLNIKSNVIDFAHLIEHEDFSTTTSSKVYSISAEFGGGKSFFCEKLKDVLDTDKIPVVKLNIWKFDFYKNPFIPLLAALKDLYDNTTKKNLPFPNMSSIIRLIKAGISGISVHTGTNDISINFDGQKAVTSYENLKELDIYKEYELYKQEVKRLKKFLLNWFQQLDVPIVIIIDELDRCKPDFAVKTLEILKHFLDIPGFIFILALDEEQLQASVKHMFGTTNFDGYKRKFINNSFILPAPDKVSFTNFLYEKSGLANLIQQIEEKGKSLVFKTFIKSLELRHFQGDPTLQAEQDFNKNQTAEKIIKKYFAAYSIWFKFSLRQMEQVFDRLVLFTRNILNGDELFSPDLAVLLVCLHEFDLKIYNVMRTTSIQNHASYRGVLNHIYNKSTNDYSIARYVYADEADKMFGPLNRDIIPKIPQILEFSTAPSGPNNTQIIIHDDVDRFFVTTDFKHPLKWIIEIQDKETGIQSMIKNDGKIALITNSKRDSRWKEIPPDIDTASDFDLAKFRQSYFDKMGFLSSFK